MSRSLSRREWLGQLGAAGALCASLPGRALFAQDNADNPAAAFKDVAARITDPLIRAGVTAAIEKNLLKAIVQRQYPGQFNITADGGAYGSDSTWPGLDSWQMA